MPRRALSAAEPPTLPVLAPGLYVVATPIGNLGDITLRALETLESVHAIACEDTRVTARLLRALGLPSVELISVREHNERVAARHIVERIARAQAIAYLTDAGTPGVSDPGAELVRAVRGAGLPVVPLPGPSALTAALAVAGLADPTFTFYGFAPRSPSALANFVREIVGRREASVFFEAPHRLATTLDALAQALADGHRERTLFIGRELTKHFEQTLCLHAGELRDWRRHLPEPIRGECVLVLAGNREAAEASAPHDEQLERLLGALLEELPPSRAARVAARATGAPRERLYALAEALRTRPLRSRKA
ncbi:MAG: 16S rRNA (cytidine(1402)-2'-O)-methyltransferase [Casimicrobiaceae bacterium]|nr:16S rRNA (cytidine(1402)-2'-O)-methyltransferase [Casimicrobiaceae bacterium]